MRIEKSKRYRSNAGTREALLRVRVCRAHVVSFQVEMRKVQRDLELSRRYDFPHAALVSGVQVRERRTRYRAVGRFDYAAASV